MKFKNMFYLKKEYKIYWDSYKKIKEFTMKYIIFFIWLLLYSIIYIITLYTLIYSYYIFKKDITFNSI